MKCKHCGAEIASDSTFCEYCGMQVGKDKSKRNRLFLLIGGIAVIAACIGVTIFFALRSPKEVGVSTEEQPEASVEMKGDGSASLGYSLSSSRVVASGDNYTAKLMFGEFNPSNQMDVYYQVGVDTLTEDQLGSAEHLSGSCAGVNIELPAGGVGSHKIAGLIQVKTPDGYKYYGFKDTYSVIQSSSSNISVDKMNVLYAGLSNPVTVGGNSSSVSFSGCSVKSTGAGKYNVTPPVSMIGKKVTATVNGSNGSTTQEFRVKKVPDPYAQIGANIWGGKKSKTELTANPVLVAKMVDEFAYDLKWTVQSYSVDVIEKGIISTINCSGSRFSQELINRINSAPAGTVFTFTNIKISQAELGTRTMSRDITIRIK